MRRILASLTCGAVLAFTSAAMAEGKLISLDPGEKVVKISEDGKVDSQQTPAPKITAKPAEVKTEKEAAPAVVQDEADTLLSGDENVPVIDDALAPEDAVKLEDGEMTDEPPAVETPTLSVKKTTRPAMFDKTWTTCASDDDCVIIKDMCGFPASVNATFKDEAQAFNDERGKTAGCITMKNIPEFTPACVRNRCALKHD